MTTTPETLPAYLTVSQAADAGGFSEPTIRKAILDGHLPASKPAGRDIRIRREDFRLWMSKGFAPAKEKQVDLKKLREEFEEALVTLEPSFDEQGREEWVWRNLAGLHKENPHQGPLLVCKNPPTLQIMYTSQVVGPFTNLGAKLISLFENVPAAPDAGFGTGVLEVPGTVVAVFSHGKLRRGRVLSVVGQDYDPRNDKEFQIYLSISQKDADLLFDLADQQAQKALEVQERHPLPREMACFVAGALAVAGTKLMNKEKIAEVDTWIRSSSDICVIHGTTFEDLVRGVLEETPTHPMLEGHKARILEHVHEIESEHRKK